MAEEKKNANANPGMDIIKKEALKLTASERFVNKVISEFGSSVGEIALTEFQKRLAQNYFIAIDAALKAAETKRISKKRGQDPLAVTWDNVNMESLARNVVAYARIGLDPAQKNHINMIPYKNNSTKKYDIGFIEGYRGIELKAIKYGLDVPDGVIVELVYTNDKFSVLKKNRDNPIESYEFDVIDPFDRGDIKGGFYYHIYSKAPEKNKLVVFSIKDIEKRKPQYASVEFWGGERDKWEYDENTGENKRAGKEHVDGWYDKMCHKTVYRAAYNDITIDSQKIDNDYLRLKQAEQEFNEAEVEAEIAENANKQILDIEPDYEVTDIQDAESAKETEAPPEVSPDNKKAKKESKQQMTLEEGPGY
jgi:recombination protein RecT